MALYVCVCVHWLRVKDMVLIPGMQKYKKGNKTAVGWFTKHTEGGCVHEPLGKVRVVYNQCTSSVVPDKTRVTLSGLSRQTQTAAGDRC